MGKKYRVDLRQLWRLARYIFNYKSALALMFFCMVMFSIAHFGRAYIAKFLVDDVIVRAGGGEAEAKARSSEAGPKIPEAVAKVGAGFEKKVSRWFGGMSAFNVVLILVITVTGLGVIACVMHFGKVYLGRFMMFRVIVDIRTQVAEHLLGLSLDYHGDVRKGELISKMTNDLAATQKAVQFTLEDVFQQPITFVVGLSVAFYVSWYLATLTFLILPVLVFVLIFFGRRIMRHSAKSLETFGDITDLMTQMFLGIRVVKSFRMEKHKVNEFRKANETFLRRVLRMVSHKALSRGATELLYNLGSALIILYGCYLFIERKAITPGDLIAFIGIIATMYRPIKSLSQSYGELAASLAGADRVFALLKLEPTVRDAPDARPLEKVERDIAFRNVSFRYTPDGDGVLKNINLRAEVGKVYAVVGRTGAGKSTLLDLVPRFYDPVEGGIEIDGVDIRKCTQASLLDHIAIVSQDPFLFNASIADNIRSGFEEITDEQVRAAADAAHVMDFAKDKPGGLDYGVGEFGNNLSGGEKQRVTIARALAKDAEILILDEATSSLDSETQKIVQDALEHLMKGRTTFVIAHRLSTIERADRIFVIENGKLVEEGTHTELLGKGGVYASLYGEELAAGQAREGNPE